MFKTALLAWNCFNRTAWRSLRTLRSCWLCIRSYASIPIPGQPRRAKQVPGAWTIICRRSFAVAGLSLYIQNCRLTYSLTYLFAKRNTSYRFFSKCNIYAYSKQYIPKQNQLGGIPTQELLHL